MSENWHSKEFDFELERNITNKAKQIPSFKVLNFKYFTYI